MDESTRWDDERLRAFASEGTLFARDEAAGLAPIGPWLLAEADVTPATADWPPDLTTYHLADRLTSMKAFMSSLERPNEVIENIFRWQDGTTWRRLRCRRVNLLDDDRAGVVLMTFTDDGLVEVEDRTAEAPAAVRYESPAWVLQRLDSLGTILDVEGRAEEVLGRTADELVGSWALDLVPPSDREAILTPWVELLERPGEVRTVQLPWVHANGDHRRAEVTLMNRLGDDNSGSVLALFHDISDAPVADARSPAAASRQPEARLGV